MVKVENLSFYYKKNAPLLSNLDISFPEGKISVILGRNGAGKSTLLQCLIGALKPQQGKVFLQGEDLSRLGTKQIAQKVAFMRQEAHSVFPYTVLDMTLMGRTPHLNFLNTPSSKDLKLAYESLEIVGMASFADRKIHELSSGERQMVLLARALCQSPQILLLDEPNTHLDIHNQWHLLRLLMSLAQEKNWTVIAVIHLPEIAYWFADFVFMLHRGQVLFSGETKQVITAENLTKIYDLSLDLYPIPPHHIALVPSLPNLFEKS